MQSSNSEIHVTRWKNNKIGGTAIWMENALPR